ncbi:MAG TPA: hypothetical protein VN441_14955 [Syntrophomonas sp.]|nr:hypothetical protein [Syntrophomonas sp.]
MTQFVLRFYYFLAEDSESLNNLAGYFGRDGYRRIDNGVQLTEESDDVYYILDYPAGSLKLLAVKTPQNGDTWEQILHDLGSREEEDSIVGNDVAGRLTILVGAAPWDELLKEAVPPFSGAVDDIIELKQGRMAWLARDLRRGEAVYLCQLNNEGVDTSFLFREAPLLHGVMLRLQALSFILKDRLSSLHREHDEMQKDLINILHTKLVMTQASLIAAEELEKEVQGLATAYGKLVGDRNIVTDGLNRFEAALQNLERQVYASSALLAPTIFLAQMSEPYQQLRDDLQSMCAELDESQENYQAAIDVVQSKIQVINSRTNIAMQEQIKGLLEVNTEMQKQGLVYQYAAGLIEFIVLAYYSHTLWSHLQHAAYTVIPSWIQFVVVMAFSGNIVWATHLIAEYVQGEVHVRGKLITALILFVLLFALIIIGSILFGNHAVGQA